MKKILSITCFFIGFATFLSAQSNPISFVVIPPPHSTYVADYFENPDLFQLQITNRTMDNIQVKVGGRLIIDGETMTETNVNDSEIFDLTPGLNILNIEDAFDALVRGDLTLSDAFENVLRTGQWPAGIYQWCFDIHDANSGQKYIEDKCIIRGVTGYSPPTLIMPFDEHVFNNPVTFVLRWSSVIPTFREGPVNYNLKVFDVKEGQTPTQALQTNFPVVEKAFLNQTVTTWPPEVPLEEGEYIWTVQATDMEDRPIGLPDSYAAPFTFSINQNTGAGNREPRFSTIFPLNKSTVLGSTHQGQNLTFGFDRGKLAESNPNAFFKVIIAKMKDGQMPKAALLEAALNKDYVYQSGQIPYDQNYIDDEIISILSDTVNQYVWKIELDYDGVVYPSNAYSFSYEKANTGQAPFFRVNWPGDNAVVRKNSPDSTRKVQFDFSLGSLAIPPAEQGKINFKIYVAEKTGAASSAAIADAIQNNTLVFESAAIPFRENESIEKLVPQLEDEKENYIWQIKAFADGKEYPGAVYSFTYNTEEVNSDFDCSCVGGDCLPTPSTNQRPKSSIAVGDVLNAGNFEIEVTSLSNASGGGAAGKGKFRLPFAEIDINTNFEGLQVNGANEVFDGEAAASQYDIYESLGLGDDMKEWKIDKSKYDNIMQHLDGINAGIGNGVEIPFSLKKNIGNIGIDLPFDLIVTDILLKPDGAAMNLLMIIPTEDGQYIKFGSEGVTLRGSGFDLSDLKLFLAEDTPIPGLGSIPFRIKSAISEDPLQGSYVQFDCNGLKEFNLQGEATFPKEMLVKTDAPDEGATALFTLNMSEWGDYLAGASFENFTIAGLDDFKFNVSNAFADRSESRNVTDIVFPEGYQKETSEAWQGFYLQEASIEVPELPGIPSLSDGKPFQLIAAELVVDSSDVSGILMGVDLLDLNSNGNENDWQFAVDTMQMHLTESEVDNISAMGKINMPLLTNPAGYQGSITKKADDNFIFNLAPSGDVELSLWRANFKMLEGSEVVVDQTKDAAGKNEYSHYANLNAGIGVDLSMETIREYVSDVTLLDELKEKLDIDVLSFAFPELSAFGFKINHPDLEQGLAFDIDSIGFEGDFVIGDVELNLREVNLLKEKTMIKGVERDGMGLQFKMSKGVDIEMNLWAVKDATTSVGWKFGKVDFEFAIPKFSCEAPVPPALAQTGGGSIVTGETYSLGGFDMTVTGSGTGTLRIPYLGSDFDVVFGNDLTVNGQNQVISGQAYTIPASGVFKPEALVTVPTGAVIVDLSQLDMTENFITTIRQSAEDFNDLPISLNRMVSKIAEVIGDVEIDLPYDVVVTGFTFDSEGGKMNAMALVDINGSYPKMGVYGMQMSPKGIALDKIKLYMIDDL